MTFGSRTPTEEERVICKGKECRHLLSRKFVDYKWVIGTCPNPDCFYHSHPQDEEEDRGVWRG